MSDIEERLKKIQAEIAAVSENRSRPVLIAVSKTFGADEIRPALEAGQRHFGENRVQESERKWPALKADYPDAVLHLIGPLQSNKAADAVRLFDVVHTVDREKIARALSQEMERQGRFIDVYVQVNTGREPQKAGILPEDADGFISRCKETHGLRVAGLMCIPPVDEEPEPHFSLLAAIAARHGLQGLSMGMSSDYPQAIRCGATCVRVGSAIFGERAKKP